MPGRTIPFITDQVYHVYNRGINKQPVFVNKRDYDRALESLRYYRFHNQNLSLSKYLLLQKSKRNNFLTNSRKKLQTVVVFAYCFMPNHFHLLVKQLVDGGISKFIGQFQNSYTRYFNIRHDRDGSLFLDQFKAVRIEDDEQLLHVSRYIHLNPYTGYVVKNINNLVSYPYNSLKDYVLQKGSDMVDTEFILGQFHSRQAFKKFVLDQADYQKNLKNIEHLLVEKP